MKLSDITAKLTCIKGNAIRVLAATVLAGAALTAAAPAAEAQHFAVGVRIGGPRYVVPAPAYYGNGYGYPGYWERRRIEEERAREAAIRRDEWARHHDGYRYDRGYHRPY
ncbi:MAG TPA: hypothetical protein VGN16_01195 [Acidobacteriaceae bacterium]|jgi:hypothetical protein